MNKKIIIVTLILVLGGVAVFGVTQAAAQSPTPFTNLIQKLSQRFNLKEADVKAVFDEAKSERQSQMQVKFAERLTQLVKDGKLTEAQKQAVIVKHKELQEKHKQNWEQFKNLTPQQRSDFMQKQRTELETWAKAQGIDLNLIFGVGMHGKFHGFGRMHMW